MTDDPKMILRPEVFFEMCKKSPQSKSHAIRVVQSARVAYGVQNVLEYLNKSEAITRQLSAEEQQYICEIFWHCMFEATHDTILKYVLSIPDEVLEEGKENAYDC
jgi:hypothetical protein